MCWVPCVRAPAKRVGLLAPHLDTDMVNRFLEQFARELSPGVHAVMIWDRAGFHTANALRVPSNVTVIKLPPARPSNNTRRESTSRLLRWSAPLARSELHKRRSWATRRTEARPCDCGRHYR